MGFTVKTPAVLPVANTSTDLIATNPTFRLGEMVRETDTNRHKIPDGLTDYNNLSYPEFGYEEVEAAGTDTYTATFATGFFLAYFKYMRIRVKFTNTNTGAATINLNGYGAKAIKKSVSAALAAGDILAGGIYELVYDGTNFQMIAGSGSVGGSSLWCNSKYHIEAGESVYVPAKYQHLYSNELINDGEITNDGELIEV